MTSTLHVKTAQTFHPVVPLIRQRWSGRAFTNQPIESHDLHTLFEAASWSPSANNEQPWLYWYAHRADSEAFNALLDCLLPANQAWAKQAAVLVASVARRTFAASGKINSHSQYDTGSANMALLIQATELGIMGHPMGGFDPQKLSDRLGLTDDHEPMVMIALGYSGSPTWLDEPFRTRETTARTRKPLTDFVNDLSA